MLRWRWEHFIHLIFLRVSSQITDLTCSNGTLMRLKLDVRSTISHVLSENGDIPTFLAGPFANILWMIPRSLEVYSRQIHLKPNILIYCRNEHLWKVGHHKISWEPSPPLPLRDRSSALSPRATRRGAGLLVTVGHAQNEVGRDGAGLEMVNLSTGPAMVMGVSIKGCIPITHSYVRWSFSMENGTSIYKMDDLDMVMAMVMLWKDGIQP